MPARRDQVGEILKKWGLIDDQKLQEASKVSEGTRKKVSEVLVDLGYVSDNDVAKALASQWHELAISISRT